MLTKEECLKELENSRFLTVSVINQDGQTEYSSDFEQTAVFNTFKQLIEEYFNPQPYKFEELEFEENRFFPLIKAMEYQGKAGDEK